MAIGGRGITVHVDEASVAAFGRSAPIARDLQAKGERITQRAKELAPVSPKGSNGRASGYGRSQVGWELGEDANGIYVDIASPALSPEGFPYMAAQEVGTSKMEPQPHLRPALDVIAGT